MFLFLATTLALAETSVTPCRMADPSIFNLSQYVGISQTLAAKGGKGKSVLYATATDPQFGDDEPIEYRFTPTSASTLTLVLVHHEAAAVGNAPITIVEIQDLLVIDLVGNVSGGQRCEIRLAMTESALQKMQEVYGF